MVLAPRHFGSFGGALLVGNFGDGAINAFDMTTGQALGHLEDSAGAPIAIDNLWGLAFGRGAVGWRSHDEGLSDAEDGHDGEDGHNGGDGHDDGDGHDGGDVSECGESPTLFFTAGIEDEGHGLLGSLQLLDQEADNDGHHGSGHGDDGDGALSVSMAGANPVHLARAGGVDFRLSSVAPVTVRLRVYDAAGRLVAEPVRDLPVSGTVVARWDGFDLGGAKVLPGTYFYHAVSGNRQVRGRLVLLR
jgi:hypothetical protein